MSQPLTNVYLTDSVSFSGHSGSGSADSVEIEAAGE